MLIKYTYITKPEHENEIKVIKNYNKFTTTNMNKNDTEANSTSSVHLIIKVQCITPQKTKYSAVRFHLQECIMCGQ